MASMRLVGGTGAEAGCACAEGKTPGRARASCYAWLSSRQSASRRDTDVTWGVGGRDRAGLQPAVFPCAGTCVPRAPTRELYAAPAAAWEVTLGGRAGGTSTHRSAVRTTLCGVRRAKRGAQRPLEKPASQWEIGLYEGEVHQTRVPLPDTFRLRRRAHNRDEVGLQAGAAH